MHRDRKFLTRQMRRAHVWPRSDMAEPHGMRGRPEVEAAAVEDAVDGTDEWASVGRHRCEAQERHSLQPFACFDRGQSAVGSDHLVEVRSPTRHTPIEEFLHRGKIFHGLLHRPSPLTATTETAKPEKKKAPSASASSNDVRYAAASSPEIAPSATASATARSNGPPDARADAADVWRIGVTQVLTKSNPAPMTSSGSRRPTSGFRNFVWRCRLIRSNTSGTVVATT